MPSLSPGPTQRQVPGSVEEGMGYVFYKWGMRLDVRGSQMLPDTKAQCRSDEAGIVQAQSREQLTSSRAVGEMGTFLPAEVAAGFRKGTQQSARLLYLSVPTPKTPGTQRWLSRWLRPQLTAKHVVILQALFGAFLSPQF